jgi:hypothetical protein
MTDWPIGASAHPMAVFSGLYESPGPPPSVDACGIVPPHRMAIKVGTSIGRIHRSHTVWWANGTTMVVIFVGLLCWGLRYFLYYSYSRKPTGRDFFIPARTLIVVFLLTVLQRDDHHCDKVQSLSLARMCGETNCWRSRSMNIWWTHEKFW